ncbi:MAG TPA: nitroreductase family protein [Ilumatobacteraceae bacterium]|nr:nitroreductase family protein [Ilumatobacteraceae bacterium]
MDHGADPCLDLSTDELLTTTRAVRRRLDLSRPVSRDLVRRCLEIAVQAPNGSNRQPWQWVVVDDPGQRRGVAEVYRGNYEALVGAAPAEQLAASDRDLASGAHLAAHLHECPVLVVPCVAGRLDGLSAADAAGRWGSILPAVWSLQLALRSRGLGSTWTTLHLHRGGERAVADVLGIPADDVTQIGLLPLAYTVGTDFRPARRGPLDEIVHWDHW